MGGAVSSFTESVSNAVSNTVGSAVDFVHAPAATVSNAVVQQRDQNNTYGANHMNQDVALVSGKSNLGSWFDNQSMADTNASMAVGTGTGTNSGARGIRNTAAVLAAIYGGAAAYGAYGSAATPGLTQGEMLAGQEAGLSMTQGEMLAAQEAGLPASGGWFGSLGGMAQGTGSNVLKSLGSNYIKNLVNPAPGQTQAEMLAAQDAGLMPASGTGSTKTALIVAGAGASLLLMMAVIGGKK